MCAGAQGPTEGNSFWRPGLHKRAARGGSEPVAVRRVEGVAGEKGGEAPADGKAVLRVEPVAQV